MMIFDFSWKRIGLTASRQALFYDKSFLVELSEQISIYDCFDVMKTRSREKYKNGLFLTKSVDVKEFSYRSPTHIMSARIVNKHRSTLKK